jgi:hypothetical protein
MGCLLSTPRNVKIKQKNRTLKEKIINFFRKKKTIKKVDIGLQTGTIVMPMSVSPLSVACSEEKDDISTGKLNSVVPSKTFSNISITEMIDIFEKTRAHKTISSGTFTIEKDDALSDSSLSYMSLEELLQ